MAVLAVPGQGLAPQGGGVAPGVVGGEEVALRRPLGPVTVARAPASSSQVAVVVRPPAPVSVSQRPEA
ncbi:MAG: hypothetical protein ACRD0M_11055, partial [Acidimicrobiales bacterium]